VFCLGFVSFDTEEMETISRRLRAIDIAVAGIAFDTGGNMSVKRTIILASAVTVISFVSFSSAQAPSQTPAEWKAVEAALGRPGKVQPDGAFKFGMPRKDLKVTVGDVRIQPGLALGAWTAFSSSGNDSMIMGDLVLTEDEVAPVIAKLQQGGIEITAIHNHLQHETPRIMYMHIGGHGPAEKLAKAIQGALAATGTPPETPLTTSPQHTDLDTAAIDRVMDRQGKDNGGIYQFAVPRAEVIRDHGMVVPASMGVATGINFQSTGSGRAAITGDFVLLASEVNPVISALREHGIEVTALHSHMLNEDPRLFFMHFWANDDAIQLAQGLRAALDKTNSKK
jgi:uncharacterized protein DUF1259